MSLPIGNYISLTTFWWMYIKGNDSFPQCSVLQHVIALDSDSVWHLLLKSYISKSRGLCKVFSQMILSQAVVENLIMSATSHGCHTHLWENPNILNQELSHGEYEIKSLEVWRGVFPPLCSSQDTVTAPMRLTFLLLSWLRICALLAIEIHAYSWAGVVLGSRTRECWKHCSIASFIKRTKVKIIDLPFVLIIPHEISGFQIPTREDSAILEIKTSLSPSMPHRTPVLCHGMCV